MFDHVGLEVADVQAARAFYDKALEPLGASVVMEAGGRDNVEAVCHRPE